MNMLKKLAIATASVAALSSGAALANGIDVIAGYDGNMYDTSFFTLVNSTTSTFSNIVFTSSGDGGNASWSWANLAAGSSATNYFYGSNGFQYDYDDYYYGNNQTYTLTGTLNGHTVTATFSPHSNATGGFVAFLGNDVNGSEYDANVSATVATISNVPEPETYAMLLAGLGLVGVIARRRKSP